MTIVVVVMSFEFIVIEVQEHRFNLKGREHEFDLYHPRR